MRDGVHLAADLYSASPEPEATALPVLLERTPYGRRTQRGSDQDRSDAPVPQPEDIARHFTEARYHVVRQDCRGRGDSEGTFVKYLGEGPDGADTIAWIRNQPWCDGRVVMTGVSYSAHVQAAAAAEGTQGLAAMFQDSGGFSCAYDAGMRMGGAFELKQVTWALRHALQSPEAAADPVLREALLRVDVPGWFGAMPWRPGCTPLRHLSAYEDFLLEQWRQDTFGDFYRTPALYGRGFYGRFPDAPSLHMGSWYDPYVRSTIENFTAPGTEVCALLPGHGPLDARAPLRDARRRSGLRTASDTGRQPRPVLPGIPPPLVRPRAGPGGRGESGGRRPSRRPVLPDGRR